MGQETGHGTPSFGSTLLAGIIGCCPSCHRGKLYSGYLTLAPRCTVCGLDYGFADAGDGPAVFVILVTGFVVVGLALIVEILYSPPYWLHAALWGPLAIIVPLVLLRSFKGVLIALQFRHKAEEGKLASE
jgi:cytochrome c oxidase subunit 3